MADAEKGKISQTPLPKPGLLKTPLIPVTIVVVCLAIAILDQTGFITLPHFGQSNVYEISPAARIGESCSYDFTDDLIPLLGPSGSTDPAIYTFYLGSGVGFPPMGLILGIDGKLKGTPTGTGGNFQVCVKDVGGRSACRTYHLTVNAAHEAPPVTLCTCPTEFHPPCHSVQNGVEMVGGPVPACCEKCPRGSSYSGTMDRVSPGGPYKICVCN